MVFGSPEDKVVPGIVSQPYKTDWVINNRLFTGVTIRGLSFARLIIILLGTKDDVTRAITFAIKYTPRYSKGTNERCAVLAELFFSPTLILRLWLGVLRRFPVMSWYANYWYSREDN